MEQSPTKQSREIFDSHKRLAYNQGSFGDNPLTPNGGRVKKITRLQ
jgi:hypothetical protein